MQLLLLLLALIGVVVRATLLEDYMELTSTEKANLIDRFVRRNHVPVSEEEHMLVIPAPLPTPMPSGPSRTPSQKPSGPTFKPTSGPTLNTYQNVSANATGYWTINEWFSSKNFCSGAPDQQTITALGRCYKGTVLIDPMGDGSGATDQYTPVGSYKFIYLNSYNGLNVILQQQYSDGKCTTQSVSYILATIVAGQCLDETDTIDPVDWFVQHKVSMYPSVAPSPSIDGYSRTYYQYTKDCTNKYNAVNKFTSSITSRVGACIRGLMYTCAYNTFSYTVTQYNNRACTGTTPASSTFALGFCQKNAAYGGNMAKNLLSNVCITTAPTTAPTAAVPTGPTRAPTMFGSTANSYMTYTYYNGLTCPTSNVGVISTSTVAYGLCQGPITSQGYSFWYVQDLEEDVQDYNINEFYYTDSACTSLIGSTPIRTISKSVLGTCTPDTKHNIAALYTFTLTKPPVFPSFLSAQFSLFNANSGCATSSSITNFLYRNQVGIGACYPVIPSNYTSATMALFPPFTKYSKTQCTATGQSQTTYSDSACTKTLKTTSFGSTATCVTFFAGYSYEASCYASYAPSPSPTKAPVTVPTAIGAPTALPTRVPTLATSKPSTTMPSAKPTPRPSPRPTPRPTSAKPSPAPTKQPIVMPTMIPTANANLKTIQVGSQVLTGISLNAYNAAPFNNSMAITYAIYMSCGSTFSKKNVQGLVVGPGPTRRLGEDGNRRQLASGANSISLAYTVQFDQVITAASVQNLLTTSVNSGAFNILLSSGAVLYKASALKSGVTSGPVSISASGSTPSSSSSSTGLSAGAAAGIAIGVVIAGLAIFYVVYRCFFMQQSQSNYTPDQQHQMHSVQMQQQQQQQQAGNPMMANYGENPLAGQRRSSPQSPVDARRPSFGQPGVPPPPARRLSGDTSSPPAQGGYGQRPLPAGGMSAPPM